MFGRSTLLGIKVENGMKELILSIIKSREFLNQSFKSKKLIPVSDLMQWKSVLTWKEDNFKRYVMEHWEDLEYITPPKMLSKLNSLKPLIFQ